MPAGLHTRVKAADVRLAPACSTRRGPSPLPTVVALDPPTSQNGPDEGGVLDLTGDRVPILIADGDVETVRRDAKVTEIYLGVDEAG